MRSCEDCPGGAACAGNGLHPVLIRVYDLYQAGLRDKFDILAGLESGDEALLERYNSRISSVCWSKAALLSIAEILGRLGKAGVDNQQPAPPEDLEAEVMATLSRAHDAFARFPWQVQDLLTQVPALHDRLLEQWPDEAPWNTLSRRGLTRMCKALQAGSRQ